MEVDIKFLGPVRSTGVSRSRLDRSSGRPTETLTQIENFSGEKDYDAVKRAMSVRARASAPAKKAMAPSTPQIVGLAIPVSLS